MFSQSNFLYYYERFMKNIKLSILVIINSNAKMSEYAEKVVKEVLKDECVLRGLKKLKEHDEYTHNHSINVAILSFLLGFSKGYNLEELIILTKGALLHDIGKTQIPLSILNKPGRLTPEEFDTIKNHSTFGYHMIQNDPLPDLSKKIILYHHTRLDDSGYPKMPEGEILHEAIQIVSLCDVFDALTGDRVYKPGMPKIAAYRIILSEMGEKLSTELLNCLMETICILDVGDIVSLNTMEKCKITAINTEKINSPIVEIIEGKNKGKRIDLSVETTYNLIYT